MSLSAEQYERAAEAEASQLRMVQLQRMNERELRVLLAGDPERAALWVRSAAEYGLPAAQLRFGRMLLDGTGVRQDQEAALRWFIRAGKQRDAEAMNMVGRCYENGWGATEDLSLAVHWYELSANAGSDWGEYNFAHMLFDGRGIARDLPRALNWYRRAAKQGHSRAMNLLGRCAEEGWGCEKNLAEAIGWYRRSAEAGYFRAQFNYAVALIERGLPTEAADWFWKAAVAGNEAIRRAIVKLLADARDPILKETVLHIANLWCERWCEN